MPTRGELLTHLWNSVINYWLKDGAIQNVMANFDRHPDAPFADVATSLQRLLDSGAAARDVQTVMRFAAYESVFATLYALDDPGVDNNDLGMLHEELLISDPSGREGRT
jgi:hypothetical protein